MEKAIRNRLRHVITQCRVLLERAVSEKLQGTYGIHTSGLIEEASQLIHLSEEDQHYRSQLLIHLDHLQSADMTTVEAVTQLTREVAFTHLNRLCAYKIMEARGLIRETVSRGLKSQGFMFYLANHADDERAWSSGQQDVAYRHFLEHVGSTISEEIGVLFSPNDPANRLFPPQRVLDLVLSLLNSEELKEVWSTTTTDDDQDETIGWVYQYFTPKEQRDQARKESQAPRNSYELAFRNQFYTPRYVVEFLVDNTLGRIWYEMRRGETILSERCKYLVRQPNEVFLALGEQPLEELDKIDALSQSDLLKRPNFISYRPKKDPRRLAVLDPACGSGHFLLYCYNLLETIYVEAYNDPELGPALQRDYPTFNTLKVNIPRLILTYNLHGIDIDLRATQIAALALWLRVQRSYNEQELMPSERPKITRSNIVCAEPMPGERDMLEEFVSSLQPPVLQQLVLTVFEKMARAGEIGTLLKIEEELRSSISTARRLGQDRPTLEQLTLFGGEKRLGEEQIHLNRFGITDAEFWNQAEDRVMAALRNYAQLSSGVRELQHRLFAEDAVQGFAFIDVCQKRYDVVLMNPPFGEASKLSKAYIDETYPRSKNDLYAAFVERGLGMLQRRGMLGAITSRTGFFLSSFERWRTELLLKEASPTVFADLGYGVLDTAAVETAAYCLELKG